MQRTGEFVANHSADPFGTQVLSLALWKFVFSVSMPEKILL
jgi:hypothetical protein